MFRVRENRGEKQRKTKERRDKAAKDTSGPRNRVGKRRETAGQVNRKEETNIKMGGSKRDRE